MYVYGFLSLRPFLRTLSLEASLSGLVGFLERLTYLSILVVLTIYFIAARPAALKAWLVSLTISRRVCFGVFFSAALRKRCSVIFFFIKVSMARLAARFLAYYRLARFI